MLQSSFRQLPTQLPAPLIYDYKISYTSRLDTCGVNLRFFLWRRLRWTEFAYKRRSPGRQKCSTTVHCQYTQRVTVFSANYVICVHSKPRYTEAHEVSRTYAECHFHYSNYARKINKKQRYFYYSWLKASRSRTIYRHTV